MSATTTNTTNSATPHATTGHAHPHEELGVHHHDHHTHGEVAMAPNDAATSASVMLDIGGGLGALVLYPGERFRGLEIEISRVDGDGRRVHTGVHERTTQNGSMLTAIFGSLPTGEYLIWEDDTTEGPVVSVPDGAIAEVRLT